MTITKSFSGLSAEATLSNNFKVMNQSPMIFFFLLLILLIGTVVKNPPANAGDTGDVGSTPGLGRSPRGGNSNPLQDAGKSHEQRSLVGYSP